MTDGLVQNDGRMLSREESGSRLGRLSDPAMMSAMATDVRQWIDQS